MPAAAGEHQCIAAAVNFANCLAHQMIDGPSLAPNAAEASPEAMALVKLSAKEVPAVVEEINHALERVQGLLQMHS